jgi:hypothetical protein
METRSIAIGLVAVVAAFAAAFALASSGGSKTESAGAGVKAAPIKVAQPAAVPAVGVGGAIPALRVQHKAHAKKKAKQAAAAPVTSSAPTTQQSAPPTQQSAPSTQNTAPAPQTQNTAPSQSAPVAPRASKPAPSNPAPVSGGTDG